MRHDVVIPVQEWLCGANVATVYTCNDIQPIRKPRISMRRMLPLFVLAAVSVSTDAFADRVIQNDSLGETINATVASAEIISGEAYEAVFDIPAEYLPENSGRPLNFLGVRVLMVNGTDPGRYCGRFSVELYDEGNNVGMPEPTCTFVDLNTFQIFNPSYKEPGAKFFDLATIPVANGPLGFVVEGFEVGGPAGHAEMNDALGFGRVVIGIEDAIGGGIRRRSRRSARALRRRPEALRTPSCAAGRSSPPTG